LYVCFFFSSRRRHTRSYGDWSSDVCSSDLDGRAPPPRETITTRGVAEETTTGAVSSSASSFDFSFEFLGRPLLINRVAGILRSRSEERRVGKECRSRGLSYDEKKRMGVVWM